MRCALPPAAPALIIGPGNRCSGAFRRSQDWRRSPGATGRDGSRRRVRRRDRRQALDRGSSALRMRGLSPSLDARATGNREHAEREDRPSMRRFRAGTAGPQELPSVRTFPARSVRVVRSTPQGPLRSCPGEGQSPGTFRSRNAGRTTGSKLYEGRRLSDGQQSLGGLSHCRSGSRLSLGTRQARRRRNCLPALAAGGRDLLHEASDEVFRLQPGHRCQIERFSDPDRHV